MSTPTEPTTPQPKPADAAGLLPEWSYSHYRATLKRNGQFFALVTPDGKKSLDAGDADQLLDALNHSAHVPAPPHAAEVRAGDGEGATAGEWETEVARAIARIFCHPDQCKVVETRILEILASLARHRTAAETVGQENPWQDIGSEPFDTWIEGDMGSTVREVKHDGERWRLMNGAATITPLRWRHIRATPPATQSALEQAREALAWLGTEDRGIVNYSRISPCKASHDCKIADGSTIKAGTIFWRIAFGPKDPSNRFATLTAALNAVLPPAKGGDGV